MESEKVILVGNPNTGKTTLFNLITKSDEHVGNWHGVTVEEKVKKVIFENHEFEIVDLPGIYSLNPLSFEEKVATDYLDNHEKSFVINILDEQNIRRNLYLTLCLLERGIRPLIIVNKMSKKIRQKIDINKLASILDVEILPVEQKTKNIKKIIYENMLKNAKKIKKNCIFYSNDINYLKNIINNEALSSNLDSLYIATKLYEKDENVIKKLNLSKQKQDIIKKLVPENSLEIIAKLRFKKIDEILTYCKFENLNPVGKSKIDKIFLNKYLCIPIFILFLFAIFYITFLGPGLQISNILKKIINENIGSNLIVFLQLKNMPIWFVSLLDIVLVGGVGGLVSFLPQIAFLFFFLSILEDSGYLSRVAFLFDSLLEKVGLSGKSVYTILMGFGCQTTACLTARNMDDKNSKIKTALALCYLSCSAKLPIYAVLGGAFFGANNVFLIMAIYVLSLVVCFSVSSVLDKTILPSQKQSFILEFPNYRFPSLKRLFKMLAKNVIQFIWRVGSLIIAVNVILFILGNFNFRFSYVPINGGRSILESVSRVISPIFVPLGFSSWGHSASLISGLIAKEVIISSILVFNGIGSLKHSKTTLASSLSNPMMPVNFTNASCFSFLVFSLLYAPCLATMFVLKKEIGRKWTIFGILVQFVVAYILTFILYTFFRAFQNISVGSLLIVFAIILAIVSLAIIIHRTKHKKCTACMFCTHKCKK